MIYPEDFCDFADKLVEFHSMIPRYNETHPLCNTNQECVLRTIIDRSYYAVLLKAKDWLEVEDGETISRANSHRDVINKIKKSSSVKNGYSIANKLRELRQERNDASYEINNNFDIEKAKKIVKKSKKAIEQFKPA